MINTVIIAMTVVLLVSTGALADFSNETTSSQTNTIPAFPRDSQTSIQPQDNSRQEPEPFLLVTPQENSVTINRRPEIRIDFTVPVDPDTVLLMIDGSDVSQLAIISAQEVVFRPFMVLPPGSHTVQIFGRSDNGAELSKSFSFYSRHGEIFQEAYSSNDLTAVYEAAVVRSHNKPTTPSNKVDANLRSETKIKSKEFSFGFNTNARYLDQSLPLMSPLRKGADVVNYQLNLGYARDLTKVQASLGDVVINETTYTAMNLARRGVLLDFAYDAAYVRLFNVRSDQVMGLRDTGSILPQFSTDNNILGVAGGIKLFNNRVEAKVSYLSGGETAAGFNVAGPTTEKKGNVTGVQLNTDLFGNRMRTELEGGWSAYDPDTGDVVGSTNSQAYRAKIGGFLEPASYELQYERVGSNFVTLGNQNGIIKDRETITARSGITMSTHSLTLSGMKQYDNLDLDPLKPRNTTYQGTLDYNCLSIQKFPFGLNYTKATSNSSHEPDSGGIITTTGMQTDTIGGRIAYSNGPLNISAMSSYSKQNDTGTALNNSTITTYSLSPSYSVQGLNVMTNFQLMQNNDHLTDVRTDTFTSSMDVRSLWLKNRLSIDVGSSYSQATNTINTTDSWNLTANSRIGYALSPFWEGSLKPSIALRGTYSHTTDRLNATTHNDAAIFLVLATAMPFIF